MELIDRDLAIMAIENSSLIPGREGILQLQDEDSEWGAVARALLRALNGVEEIPAEMTTAAEWNLEEREIYSPQYKQTFGRSVLVCSHCGYDGGEYSFRFCPSCGSRMQNYWGESMWDD